MSWGVCLVSLFPLMETKNMDQEKPKILYVDDEPLNLSSFKYLYKRYYNIYLADSGYGRF